MVKKFDFRTSYFEDMVKSETFGLDTFPIWLVCPKQNSAEIEEI